MGNTRWRFTDTFLKMDITTCLSLLVAIVTLATPAQSSEPRVVCYYTNWSVYRPGTAKFNPQNINPYLCTHLIYAFGAFTKDNTLKPFDKYQDIEKGGYAKFSGLKTYNKNLKTLLAIGGWNEGSTRFSPMVASRERRKEFVRNAIKFLRQNRFDGLDLDWEYPAFRDGGKPKDRDNYAKLVKELREEFERESEKTGKPRLLLTMAVPAGIEYIQKGFDVKTLNKYLDWMNMLTYDYHSAFEPAVNHHAPLFPLEEPNEYSTDNELNIDYTIKFYLENGADRDKLVLGIPTYGRSYTLFNPDAVEIGSPADGPGEQGDATREKGYLAYYEICEALKSDQKKRSVRQADDDDDDDDDDDASDESTEVDEPWTVMYPNPNAMGPVAFKGNQWVGYDDIEIVKKKAEYVAENGLGGIMFWSIDNDDFRGNCHEKPYPLIEAAKEAYISKLGATDNAIVSERPLAVTKASSKRRNRPRPSTTTTTTSAKPVSAAKTISTKRKSSSSFTSTTPAWNAVTPEPPTTPDPGADFKCKDEGFFPHPRDCKKYFWCLDSGPSNLGIVAHQFTCPSGLFFNKAADSCDFARNVLCKKPSATTKATTKAATTSTTSTTTTTTTRRPIKLSTKNSVLFRTTTTTTTTTPEPESQEEYEEDAQEDAGDVDAEDPKVIKELIDLIKKVGGVEQLEKHLHLSETSVSTDGPSTPSSLNKKLYKVLERTRGKNKFNFNTATEARSSSQNSRRGPQNAGLEPTANKNVLIKKDRPQYTTINRARPSTTTTEETVASEEENEEPVVYSPKQSRARIVESEDSGTTSKTLQYVNIRRAPPASTSDTADDTASRNALFERAEPYVGTSETPSTLDIIGARRENMPEYVTIRRQRPTTVEVTTAQYVSSELNDEKQGKVLEKEISSQPQYTSIVRARSTTLPPPEDIKIPEPTTVLAVQISSLLNSPSPTEADVLETETEAPPTEETEPTTTSTTTTTTTSTTTTTTTPTPLILPSSNAPRPLPIRRRGSTTITPFTTIQVSPRNYTLVSRRRRPVSTPNEIPTDSDETNEISRKIRSTTPNSRETVDDKVRIGGQIRQIRRKKIRVQPLQTDEDSVPAAASPVSRGQFRPQISRDEVVSLTPIDNEPLQAVQRPSFNPRNERRFRGRTTVAEVNNIEDSEVSAATVDVRRPSFPSRGRGRFAIVSTTAINDVEPVVTESTPSQRRPTIARFTPRPFNARRVPPSEDSVTEENPDISNIKPFTRNPTRLSFGSSRPTLSTVIQGRKLPFPSFRLRSTTEETLTSNDDDDLDNKPDDISLSESTIEEKEHEDDIETTTQLPKRRIIIKKLRTPVSSTTENTISTEAIVNTDENITKRFRVIRRRPTSTTVEQLSDVSTENPTSTRIRKVIRKKLKPVEDEAGIIAKSVSSLNASPKDSTTETVYNYGEKTSTKLPNVYVKETETDNEEVDQIIPELLKVESSTGLKNKETEGGDVEVSKNNNSLDKLTENNEVTENTILTVSSDTEIENHSENVNNDPSSDTKITDVNDKEDENNQNNSESDKISETGNISVENQSEQDNKTDNLTETDNSELNNKPEVIVENEQKSVDLSDTEAIPKEEPVSEEQPETTTPSTTTTQKVTPRTRLPYRPSKRLFTSSTEGSVPSSSRTFSRKYNPGAYTTPATSDNQFRSTTTTRRPLFTPRQRRPYTTARTTTKALEEEYYSEEETLDEEEPENPLVFLPANEHFPRNPPLKNESEEEEEEYDNEPEEESEEEVFEEEKPQNVITTTSKKPSFQPRVVNSNSFRASTSESPRKPFSGSQSQNQTVVRSRFASNKPVNDTKKRVQNVPVGYNSPVANSPENAILIQNKTNTTVTEKVTEATTTSISDENEMETVDDDYLTMTEATTETLSENTNTDEDVTSTNTIGIETVTMEISNNTDDYLEYTMETTPYPSTQDSTVNSEVDVSDTETIAEPTTEAILETTTSTPVTPKVKTQFDKLFSVSRVVEVSSKLDKHRLNKNNETTLIEEGKIVVEKKPAVDKIGEVSRFSYIKIVEDEIPIYLTKLGHLYPVENPPDNPIRIDEARNARALTNFAEAPRENLVASESINEAYRHIKKATSDYSGKDRVERVAEDDFLSYINEDKKPDNSQEDLSSNWQFIPAAYENEKLSQNKAAKSFEIITPRTMLTDPSTLPLEALFQTETPVAPSKLSDVSDGREKQPFVVYSASLPTQMEEANIVKLQVIKPETGRSIVTFAKGQEFNGAPVVESNIKYPISISVLPMNSEGTSTTSTTSTTTTTTTTEKVNTSPLIELLTTTQSTTLFTDAQTTTDIPTTTEVVTEEITTQKSSLLDAKRTKFAFPRRPAIKTNITRPAPRTFKKLNTTSSNLNLKPTKTFTPSVRYSNRAQNVPVDIRKGSTPKVKTFTTETPRTTTERKVSFKPLRPGFRPAFVPRKNRITTTPPTTES